MLSKHLNHRRFQNPIGYIADICSRVLYYSAPKSPSVIRKGKQITNHNVKGILFVKFIILFLVLARTVIKVVLPL